MGNGAGNVRRARAYSSEPDPTLPAAIIGTMIWIRIIRHWGICLSCAFVVALTFIKAPFSRYLADDFSFAAGYRDRGFWQFQREVYDTVGGRYTATFLEMVVSAAGRDYAWLFPAAGLVALAVVVALSTRALLHTTGIRVDSVSTMLLALVVLAGLLDTAPNQYQSLFWVAGFLIYGLPVVLAGAVCLLLLRSARSDPGWRGTTVALAALLAFIGAGCSETAAVCQVAGFGAMTIFVRRGTRLLAATALAASLIGLMIVAASDGNALRRAALEKLMSPLPLPTAAQMALSQLAPAIDGLARRALPYLLFGTALLLPRGGTSPATGREDQRPPILNAAVASVAVIVCVVGGSLLLGMWSLGSFPPARAMYVTNAWVLASLLVALVHVVPHIPPTRVLQIAFTAAAFAAMLLGPLRYPKTRITWVSDAREFARLTDSLDRFARMHPGEDLIIGGPRLVEGLEFLSRDPDRWTNESISTYYRISSIKWRHRGTLSVALPTAAH